MGLDRHRPDHLPGDVPGPARPSLAGKALERGDWRLDAVDLRGFTRTATRPSTTRPSAAAPAW